MALDADVLGPLHEAGEVSLGLDVATDSKVASVLLEEGALDLLVCASTASNNLLALSDFLHLKCHGGSASGEEGEPESSRSSEDSTYHNIFFLINNNPYRLRPYLLTSAYLFITPTSLSP